MTLALSIAALLLGPLVYSASRPDTTARRILDGVILLAIAAIIATHVVPEALRHGGKMAILVLIFGLAFPMLLERLFRKATDTAHLFVVALAAAGLLMHAVIDGVALHAENGAALAYAIVLHRLPVGMAMWCIVRPNFGITVTVALFALTISATIIGYFLGGTIAELAETRTLAMLQAFISGSLIHVVLFRDGHHH
jgi:CDP-diglyceride synthetase